MIRPLLSEIALFLAPFAAYAVFLLATRANILDMQAWSPRVLAWLTATALILMIGSFVLFAHFYGAPAGSTYEPAHLENGNFVPGQMR